MFIRNVVWLMIVNQPFMKWLFSPSLFVSCSLESFWMVLSSLTFVSSVAHSFVVKQTVCVIWIFLSYYRTYSSPNFQTNILFRNLLMAKFYCNINNKKEKRTSNLIHESHISFNGLRHLEMPLFHFMYLMIICKNTLLSLL